MGSYAHASTGESHSRLQPKGHWSEYQRSPVVAVEDSLDGLRRLDNRTGLAGCTVGGPGFPSKLSTTDPGSQVEAGSFLAWPPGSRSHADSYEGSSADQLLDDLRRAMERNPEGARAAVMQLVTSLAPPTGVEPAS